MNSSDLRGVGLSEEDFKKGNVIFNIDHPKLEYSWDAGIAISRYLQELKNGRLIARKCCQCKRIMIPPRMFCEMCFRETDEWVYVKDTGTVNTFSLCYVTWDMQWVKKPQIPAVIEIDGASKGMGILHHLKVDPKKAKTGLRVKAVWKKAGEREGSITDLMYFEPL